MTMPNPTPIPKSHQTLKPIKYPKLNTTSDSETDKYPKQNYNLTLKPNIRPADDPARPYQPFGNGSVFSDERTVSGTLVAMYMMCWQGKGCIFIPLFVFFYYLRRHIRRKSFQKTNQNNYHYEYIVTPVHSE